MFCGFRNGWIPKEFAGTNRNGFCEAEKIHQICLQTSEKQKYINGLLFISIRQTVPPLALFCTLLSITITAYSSPRSSFLLLLHSFLVELDNPLALSHPSLFVCIFSLLLSDFVFFFIRFTWKLASDIDQSSGCCRLASETSTEHTFVAIFSPPCFF